ncbi:unknown [Firmicutes bacterium CAG:238]|nr:unknown [Firmicutes bacterium CAG:238]
MIAVLTKAFDGNIHIQTDVFVHDTERDCTRGAVFVSHQLFRIEIVHALVLWRLSAEGKTFPDVAEAFLQTFAELAGKDARLGGIIKDKFARLCADLYNLTLLHDHHKLSVRDCDDGTAADDIVGTLGVGCASANSFFTLNCDDIFRHGLTIKILFPLVSQISADCSQSCFD